MSIEAMRAVWRHSETKGTSRMVLTLIANSANPEGWHSYQKQTTLMEGANASLRTVERCVEEAIALGELEVHRPDRTKQNHYSVLMPGLAIFEDPDERARRDEHYEQLALGRAEKTRQNREVRDANRRSEDPTPVTGPSANGPDTSDGCDPTAMSGADPTSTTGAHPTPVTGLKEETSLNPSETPVKEIALAAEGLWNLWPHKRRNLNAQRTLDVLRGLGADNLSDIERITAAAQEDIQSADFREGFVPNFSNWLRDRQWDRPLGDVVQLAALVDVEFPGPDPDFDHRARDFMGDAADLHFAPLQHGRRGDTYILAGHERTLGWVRLRYLRSLTAIATDLGFAGLELVTAETPQITKENAA